MICRRDPGRFGACVVTADVAGQNCLLFGPSVQPVQRTPAGCGPRQRPKVLARLVAGEVVVGSVLAQRLKLQPGNMLHLSVGTDSQTLRIAGIVNDYTAGGLMVYIDRAAAEKFFGITGVDAYLISTVRPTPQALADKLAKLADEDGCYSIRSRRFASGSTAWYRASLADCGCCWRSVCWSGPWASSTR